MFRLAAIPVLAMCFTTPVFAIFGTVIKSSKSHVHHLLQAEKDLHSAEAAIAANNTALAHKSASAAAHQVEEAIHHHKTFVIDKLPTGHGLSSLILHAKHHHHHGLLHEALKHIHSAEESLKAGNGTAAVKHIENGGKAIQASLASHKKLLG
jgi:hypothetical protein